MSDLIERQVAIDAIRKSASKFSGFMEMEMYTVDDAIKAVNTVPSAEPHWIPCSKRLPEAPFGCLVTVEDEEPMTGALFPNLLPYFVGWDGEQWNDADGEQCPFEVLAWMPLPKPYEVKE